MKISWNCFVSALLALCLVWAIRSVYIDLRNDNRWALGDAYDCGHKAGEGNILPKHCEKYARYEQGIYK